MPALSSVVSAATAAATSRFSRVTTALPRAFFSAAATALPTAEPALQPKQFYKSVPLSFEELTQLARHRGFVSPSSEIYGGVKGQYDYGPVGVLLKRNVVAAWWKRFVQERADVVGVDTAIIQHPKSTCSYKTLFCVRTANVNCDITMLQSAFVFILLYFSCYMVQ